MTRTYAQWLTLFLEEGEECVRLRQQFGDYINDPYSAAHTYAAFCAFDAIHKGLCEVDMKRAREIAERMTNREPTLNRKEAA